jgi:hypothetical protein
MTVKLQTLVMTTEWVDLKKAFLKLYPSQDKNIAGYEEVYYTLLSLEPEETDQTLHIRQNEGYTDDDPPWFEVYGTDGSMNEHAPEHEQTFALEYTSWGKWLSMPVHYMTMEQHSNIDIVAHCIYGMTFCGFNQETIKESLDELDRRMKSLEDGTAKTYSWDEIKDRLKEKFGFELDDEDRDDNAGDE